MISNPNDLPKPSPAYIKIAIDLCDSILEKKLGKILPYYHPDASRCTYVQVPWTFFLPSTCLQIDLWIWMRRDVFTNVYIYIPRKKIHKSISPLTSYISLLHVTTQIGSWSESRSINKQFRFSVNSCSTHFGVEKLFPIQCYHVTSRILPLSLHRYRRLHYNGGFIKATGGWISSLDKSTMSPDTFNVT